MMKTLDLLDEAVNLGFDREKALADIDASLDNELGFENRKPLTDEEISDELATAILEGFKEEAEWR